MKKTTFALSILLIIFLFCSCSFPHHARYYIYADIGECQLIEERKHDDALVQRYDTPNKDKALKDLSYVNFYGAYYSSSELEFEIFAYEFHNKDDAKKYFNQVTGKDEQRDQSLSAGKGLTSYQQIVMDGENVYAAYSSSGNSEKLQEYLGTVFSVLLFDFGE